MSPELKDFLSNISSAHCEVFFVIDRDGNLTTAEAFDEYHYCWYVNDLEGTITIGQRNSITTDNLYQIVAPVKAEHRDDIVAAIKAIIDYDDMVVCGQEEATYTYRYVWIEKGLLIQIELDHGAI